MKITSAHETNKSVEPAPMKPEMKQSNSSKLEKSSASATFGEIFPFFYMTIVGLICLYSYY